MLYLVNNLNTSTDYFEIVTIFFRGKITNLRGNK